MVRCFDCCYLIKSWKPTTKSDWLFEDRWKCKVTDEQLVEYYLIHKERECKHWKTTKAFAGLDRIKQDVWRLLHLA